MLLVFILFVKTYNMLSVIFASAVLYIVWSVLLFTDGVLLQYF
jgi:hypothetical protein